MEPTPGPGGSKQWMYIVGGVIVLGIAGWLISRTMGGAAENALQSATGGDVDINRDGTQGTITTGDTSVTWGTNKKPENWPSDVPVYAGGTISYAGSSNTTNGTNGSAVILTTGDSTQKVTDYYKKELADKGWHIDSTVQNDDTTVISATKDTRALSVSIVRSDEGTTTVTMGVGTKN